MGPLQINFFWNLGFLLGIAIILQIVTGIFLALHYTSDLNSAYSSVFFLIREVYYGCCLRYFHSSGASFVFLFLFLHLGRAIFYGSYFYNSNTWFSGIFLLFLLMAIAFMGYVLPFGQMSFWGATVITNLLSPFPSLVEWFCGGYCVYSPTLKRFFLFHFIFPFLVCALLLLHLFYLHFHSSSNPLHIVPEWYFLCQYAILKAVPNKNAGFIILLTSILIFFFFPEIRNLTTFTRLMDCNNGFSISFFFLSFLSFLWIGAQFHQEKFLSYARILTYYFYFLLMCILFSKKKKKKKKRSSGLIPLF